MTGKEKISKVIDSWFMNEPFFFDIYCTHKLEENSKIQIPFRTGKRRIEYNSEIINELTVKQIEHLLKIEVMRIILKHPYQRVPPEPNKAALVISSDITIYENCFNSNNLCSAKYYNLLPNLSYEEYYKELSVIIPQETYGTNYENAEEAAGLWDEDEEICDEINQSIEKAQMTNRWGSVSENNKEIILASLKIPMDYRRILSQFRACLISQKRKLTRMKPNRRYDFDYMGSKFEPQVKLLVAVDVSGSVDNDSLNKFFSIINRFFSYGVEEIYVITFDTEIKQELKFKKACKNVKVIGRGGTSFQCVIDYYENHPEFHGLIIFTDGYAEIPTIHKYKQILWILIDKKCYENSIRWIKNFKQSRATYIPFVKGNGRI